MMYLLVIAGSILNLLGTSHYIWDTVKGVTKPNRITWLMWSIAPMIGTSAALVQGVTWATLPVFMSGFCPFLVFLASFVNPNAYWKLETFDYGCGVLSVLALVLWLLTNNPTIAIIFAIGSDTLAAVPTLLKSWRYPETETATVYSVSVLNNLTSFLVIRQWNFAQYAFPSYLVLMNIALTFLVLRRKIGLRW
jgi:hypothetical protein